MLKADDVGVKFLSRPLISKHHSSILVKLNPPVSSNSAAYVDGVSVGVPFLWESKPGTPLHASSGADDVTHCFPPLNPPPRDYNGNATQTPMRMRRRGRSKSFSLRSLLPTKFLRNKWKQSVIDADADGDGVMSPCSSSSASSTIPSSPRGFRSPLAFFRRSRSTSIRHSSKTLTSDYELYDDAKSTSVVSRGFARCFRASRTL